MPIAAAGFKPVSVKGYPKRIDADLMAESLTEAMTEQLMMACSVLEPCTVRVKPKFPTAMWTWQPPHAVYVGDALLGKPYIRSGLSREEIKGYIKAHYFHEQGHALYTERDLGRVNRALKTIKATFELFNLFEDARIEHRYRSDNAFKFNWLAAESPSVTDDPQSIFWGYIQHEGAVKDVVALCLADKSLPSNAASLFGPSKLSKTLNRVEDYYWKACNAESSMALIPLIADWVKEFGCPPEKDRSELGTSFDIQAGAPGTESFDADTVDPFNGEGRKEEDVKASGIREKLVPENSKPIAAKGRVLGTSEVPVNMARAAALADKMRKLFKDVRRKESTWVPRKRISVKHLVTDRAPYRHAAIKSVRKKNITVVFECSGSMDTDDSHPIKEGKVFLSALSKLARENAVEGHILVCAHFSSGVRWELLQFPVSQSCINRIEACPAGEGIEATLRDNIEVLANSEYVFVYTDAQISDEPINRKRFHERGIKTWGLYVGSDPANEVFDSLLTYFDKAIVKPTAEALVDAILVQI